MEQCNNYDNKVFKFCADCENLGTDKCPLMYPNKKEQWIEDYIE